MDNDNDKNENLRTEYITGNDAYMHYDNYSWHVGAVLIAGVFVFWGFLLETENLSIGLSILSSILVFAIMTCWLIYTFHNRQIYLYKLHRLREIEGILGGMSMHSGFDKDKNDKIKYNIKGVKGHQIDIAIYLILSNGTFFLSLIKEICTVTCRRSCFDYLICKCQNIAILLCAFIVFIIISIFFLIYINANDKYVKDEIEQLKKKYST